MCYTGRMTRKEYNTIHQWVLRHYTKSGICGWCEKSCRTHWSNKYGLYIKEDRNDWQELCPSCHGEYDKTVMKEVEEIKEAMNRVAKYPWFDGSWD